MSEQSFQLFIYTFFSSLFHFKNPNSKMRPHHNSVQLILDGLVRALAVLVRVVHREGFSENQRGVGAHLKIRNLQTPNGDVKPERKKVVKDKRHAHT